MPLVVFVAFLVATGPALAANAPIDAGPEEAARVEQAARVRAEAKALRAQRAVKRVAQLSYGPADPDLHLVPPPWVLPDDQKFEAWTGLRTLVPDLVAVSALVVSAVAGLNAVVIPALLASFVVVPVIAAFHKDGSPWTSLLLRVGLTVGALIAGLAVQEVAPEGTPPGERGRFLLSGFWPIGGLALAIALDPNHRTTETREEWKWFGPGL